MISKLEFELEGNYTGRSWGSISEISAESVSKPAVTYVYLRIEGGRQENWEESCVSHGPHDTIMIPNILHGDTMVIVVYMYIHCDVCAPV